MLLLLVLFALTVCDGRDLAPYDDEAGGFGPTWNHSTVLRLLQGTKAMLVADLMQLGIDLYSAAQR